MDKINKLDAVLHVDTYCWKCEKAVALSNTIEFDGKRYCYSCAEELQGFNIDFNHITEEDDTKKW